jgi:Zn-dependent protease with chaperone function
MMIAHANTTSLGQSAPAAQPDDQQGRAREKARIQRALSVAQYFINLLALAALFLTRASVALKTIASRVSKRRWVEQSLFVSMVLVLLAAINLPIDYVSGYSVPSRYGLVNQSVGGWLRDYVVGGAVGFIVLLVVTLGVYVLLRRSPRWWWVWVTGLSAPVIVFLTFITPTFITPLFNDFTPLPEGPLKQEILRLAAAHGVPSEDVFVIDASRQSKTVNAYVIGVGETKRIVLYDTLLKDFAHEEIKFVLAHEIGHYVLHHVWKFVLVSVLLVLLGTLAVHKTAPTLMNRVKARAGASALTDIAGLPQLVFVLLIVLGLAFPVVNAYSRAIEHEADRFAIRATQNTKAAVSAFKKLAKLNVSELDPGPVVEFVFYSHPTLSKRIDYVRTAGQSKQ